MTFFQLCAGEYDDIICTPTSTTFTSSFIASQSGNISSIEYIVKESVTYHIP